MHDIYLADGSNDELVTSYILAKRNTITGKEQSYGGYKKIVYF